MHKTLGSQDASTERNKIFCPHRSKQYNLWCASSHSYMYYIFFSRFGIALSKHSANLCTCVWRKRKPIVNRLDELRLVSVNCGSNGHAMTAHWCVSVFVCMSIRQGQILYENKYLCISRPILDFQWRNTFLHSIWFISFIRLPNCLNGINVLHIFESTLGKYVLAATTRNAAPTPKWKHHRCTVRFFFT